MKLNTFQKTALITVFATLFLIFVGGLVRSAGAGLGCPDWPKCFGTWIPPTHVGELPPAFDPSQFNATKMWIEYINRLIGVVIGLLIIATTLLSLKYVKTKPIITISSVLTLLLVIFQGWLGGQVVRSALDEWLITLHMLLAMVIVNLLIFVTFKAFSDQLRLELPKYVRKLLLIITSIMLFASVIQMGLGTQVREAIDAVVKANPGLPRDQWLERVGFIDHIHRSTSWSVLILGVYLFSFINKFKVPLSLRNTGYGIFLVIILQVLLGVGLAYMGMPAAFQVLHLTFAAILVSGLMLMLYLVIHTRIREEEV